MPFPPPCNLNLDCVGTCCVPADKNKIEKLYVYVCFGRTTFLMHVVLARHRVFFVVRYFKDLGHKVEHIFFASKCLYTASGDNKTMKNGVLHEESLRNGSHLVLICCRTCQQCEIQLSLTPTQFWLYHYLERYLHPGCVQLTTRKINGMKQSERDLYILQS